MAEARKSEATQEALLRDFQAELGANAAPDLPSSGTEEGPTRAARTPNLELIMRIPVTLTIVLGRASMQMGQLAQLGCGSTISLDRKIGDPVDVLVNGRVVAHGEVVVTEGDASSYAVCLTEVVGPAAAEGAGW